jgi:hypothetical protein
LQTTVSYLSSGDFYDSQGFKQTLPGGQKFRDITTNLHLEYGLRDKVGFVLGLPVRNLKLEQSAPPDLVAWGFGDLTSALRFRLVMDPVVAAVQAEVKLPTGYNASLQNPPLGDGQTDYTGRLLLGKSLPSFNGFAQAAGGYRHRTGAPADEFLFNADAGSWLADRALVGAHWEYSKHRGDQRPFDRFQGGVTARYRAWRRFDVLGGLFHIFGGENVPAGTQLFVGVTARGNGLGKFEGPLSSSLSESPAPKPAAPAPAPSPPSTESKPVPPPAPEAPASPDTSSTPKG